jgi:tRNA(adenine34) deaminase
MNDEHFMRQAMNEAQKAYLAGEVPVGAVVVCNNRIIARGYNQTERLHDVTAHAEIIALTAATEYLGSKYLDECTLYVTLEPCVMCAGALAWAQLGRLVFA